MTDEYIVPLKDRLFAHCADNGKCYCYGSNLAYEFTGQFKVRSSAILQCFPYHNGFSLGGDVYVKEFPHFYQTVTHEGGVYGHLNGFIFRFDGLAVSRYPIAQHNELPHNKLISHKGTLYLTVNSSCFVCSIAGQSVKQRWHFTTHWPDLRVYSAGDHLLFRQNSRFLMEYEQSRGSLAAANCLVMGNMWYEGRRGDVLFFTDVETMIYYIVDCRMDICCYAFQAESKIPIDAAWTDNRQWQMSDQYVRNVLSMRQLMKYKADPHIFRQCNSPTPSQLVYQYPSDYVLHRMESLNIAQYCFKNDMRDELFLLISKVGAVSELFFTGQFFTWMISHALKQRTRQLYSRLVQFLGLFLDSVDWISRAFQLITDQISDFEPFECFPVELAPRYYFQRAPQLITAQSSQFIALMSRSPLECRLAAVESAARALNLQIFTSVLPLIDLSQLVYYNQSPAHICIVLRWHQGLQACLQLPDFDTHLSRRLQGDTLLFQAVLHRMPISHFMVQAGIYNSDNTTALMHAVDIQDIAALVPFELNMRTSSGQTALMLHMHSRQRLEGVEPLLVEAGVVDARGVCALDYADLRDEKLVMALLQREWQVFRGLKCKLGCYLLKQHYQNIWHFKILQKAFGAELDRGFWCVENQDLAHEDEFGRSVEAVSGECGSDIFGRDLRRFAVQLNQHWDFDRFRCGSSFEGGSEGSEGTEEGGTEDASGSFDG